MIAMLGLPVTDSNRRMIEAAVLAETAIPVSPPKNRRN